MHQSNRITRTKMGHPFNDQFTRKHLEIIFVSRGNREGIKSVIFRRLFIGLNMENTKIPGLSFVEYQSTNTSGVYFALGYITRIIPGNMIIPDMFKYAYVTYILLCTPLMSVIIGKRWKSGTGCITWLNFDYIFIFAIFWSCIHI